MEAATVCNGVELYAGATLLVGGARAADLGPNFYLPTVLGDATTDMAIFREETFGPVTLRAGPCNPVVVEAVTGPSGR